jgi:hypothetical protein
MKKKVENKQKTVVGNRQKSLLKKGVFFPKSPHCHMEILKVSGYKITETTQSISYFCAKNEHTGCYTFDSLIPFH